MIVAFLFTLFFVFLKGSPRFSSASSSLRTSARLEDVLEESCGNDVEDELAPELDDNPGTSNGYEMFCLALDPLSFFGQMWLLTAGPLIGKTMLFAELAQ